jgi:hypothetical protein
MKNKVMSSKTELFKIDSKKVSLKVVFFIKPFDDDVYNSFIEIINFLDAKV